MGFPFKKFMFLLSASATLGLSVSGNESIAVGEATEEASALTGEVTFWTASLAGEPFDSYFEDIKAEFEALHPEVSVNIQDIPQNEMEQKVLTSLTGNDAPDVVNLNPHYMANIGTKGGLLELDDYVSEGYEEVYVEGALNSGRLNDKLYALPWYLTTTVGWYNNAHFEAGGVDTIPTTTSEIHEVARSITEATNKPSYYQIINDGNTIMEKMVTLANGEPIVENGVAVFNKNEDIVEYFTVIQEMYEEGLISQQNVEGSIGTAQELFMSENLSFVEGGITFLGPIESGAPEVYKNMVAGDPFGPAEAPMNIAVMNLAVPANSDNPEAAVAFAEFVLNAENQLEFSKTAGTVLPSTVESLEDPYFTDPGDSPKALGMKAGALTLARAKVLIPATENNSELRETTLNVFVEVMTGTKDPQEALDQLAEQWTQSFEKAGLDISF